MKKEGIVVESPKKKSPIRIIIKILIVLLILAIIFALAYILYDSFKGKERFLDVDENIEEARVIDEKSVYIILSDNINLSEINTIDFVFSDGEYNYTHLAIISKEYEIIVSEIGLDSFEDIIKVRADITYKAAIINNTDNPSAATNNTDNGDGSDSIGGGGDSGDNGGCDADRDCDYYYDLNECGENLYDGCENVLDCNNCYTGEYCYKGDGVSNVCLSDPVNCIDSDGLDYYIKGNVTIDSLFVEDFCSGNLAEFYCYYNGTDFEARNESFDCPHGCSDGKCDTAACTEDSECSLSNIGKIEICTNNPDNNPFTWDYRAAFTSECIDNSCTVGDSSVQSNCISAKCNAECNDGQTQESSDLYCFSNDLYKYVYECNETCAFSSLNQANDILEDDCIRTCNGDGCYNNKYNDYSDSSDSCVNNACIEPTNCQTPISSVCEIDCGAECEAGTCSGEQVCDTISCKCEGVECTSHSACDPNEYCGSSGICQARVGEGEDCSGSSYPVYSGESTDYVCSGYCHDDYDGGEFCVSTTSECTHDGITYNDNALAPDCYNVTNVRECGSGSWILGVSCRDNDACNGIESCSSGVCSSGIPLSCNNGLYCDGVEICNALLGCQSGTPIDCTDTISCTDDSCNEGTNSCNNIPNDGLCESNEYCDSGFGCTPNSCEGTDLNCGTYPICGNCNLLDGCDSGELRDYSCSSSNNCEYTDITIEENATNGNCNDWRDNDCDGQTDDEDSGCQIVQCGDGVCEPGENCPQDAGSCQDNICYIPTCNNGCGESLVGEGSNDDGCASPNICDGNGNCILEILTDIEVSIASLESAYSIGEDIDITDPPENYIYTYQRTLSSEEVENTGDFVEGELIIKLKNTAQSSISSYSEISPELNNRVSEIESKYSLAEKNPVFEGLHEKLKSQDMSPEEHNQEIKSKFSYFSYSDPSSTAGLLSVYLMKINDGEGVLDKVKKLNNDPNIEYAQPNYVRYASYVPNDPYFSSSGSWGQAYGDLWGIKLIEADDAWDLAEGDGAIVAVVDTGIGYNHEDLKDNMWTNPGEIAGNNKDDDGNGYVDDIHGYNFVDNNGNPLDDNGHGSHCAGTIAGVGNNAIGVIGVAPRVKLMAAKGLNSAGSGTSAQLANGMIYAVDNGARVLSNSWGPNSRSPDDPTSEDAAAYAVSKGVIVVFAAGNSDDDVAYYSPANKDTTIAVAASTPGDEKCAFSNYGDLIDVSAPGGGLDDDPAGRSNILSTLPEGVTLATSDRKVSNGYYKLAGTSMATPHVAGLAGLIISVSPDLTYEEVKGFIRDFAEDIGDPGKDSTFGYGRINALWTIRGVMGDIKIELTSPSKGSYVKGTVNLIGTIYSESYFEKYEIYYADEKDLGNLILIDSSTTPIEDGVLASWDTTKTNDGKKIIILKIITDDGSSLQKSFEINVDNVNEPPIFEGNPNLRVAYIGDTLQFGLVAQDPDDPASSWGILTYRVENLPPGATYNTNTNMFSWTPTVANKGTYVVSFFASDSDFTTQFDLILATLQINKTKLTSDSISQSYPSIYQDKVVWQESGIYLYDLTSGQKTKISSLSSGTMPKIQGDNVVWIDGTSIYSYNILTNQENTEIEGGRFDFFEIDDIDFYGNKFVYLTSRGLMGVFSYNIETDTKHQYSNSLFAGGPSVYENFLTFSDWGIRSGIYRYNLDNSQGGLIVEGEFAQADPEEPDAYENKVVYLGASSFGASDLRVIDLSNDEISFVNSDTTYNSDPRIYGDAIVWTSFNSRDGTVGDINVYDLNIQQKMEITSSGRAKNQDIYGDKIVYIDRASGDSSDEVYVADLYYSPIIFYVEPSLVPSGGTFKIIGDNFGHLQGDSKVRFENGEESTIISWSDEEITCRVPNNPPASGKFKVITAAGESNWGQIGIGSVESYVKNNEDFAVTGNLKMILQKKLGGSWIDEDVVVNQEVTLPANNRIKLDSYWNNHDVSASSEGDYRIYAEFEFQGRKYYEDWWIDVSGGVPSLKSNMFSKLIAFIKSLIF